MTRRPVEDDVSPPVPRWPLPRPHGIPDQVAGEFGGLSQVILSVGIPFGLVPLVLRAAGKHVVGAFAIGRLSRPRLGAEYAMPGMPPCQAAGPRTWTRTPFS